MRKFITIIMSFLIICTTFNTNSFAEEKEMRAAWVSSVYNMDWPSSQGNSNKQKQELITMLDTLKSVGINAVMLQVRPNSDALYKSSINPWSQYLTGTQGKDPGYDPLEFAIQEAHKRGMEIHAWFNPYRVTTSGFNTNNLAQNHPAKLHPEWLLKSSNNIIYNPGLPEVRKYIVDTVMEVVKKYDIDGVHFDDYFYRAGIDDTKTYNQYGNGMSKDDWRRENVNTLLKEVKESIKKVKPSVSFGVSPSGIWRNKSSDPTGSDTKGKESYSSDYADTRTWIKRGLVDYVVPQIYWTRGYAIADYTKLVDWWANEVKGTNVKLYIGQGIYRPENSSDTQDVASEIKEQILLNRTYEEISGSVFFSARNITGSSKLSIDRSDQIQKDLKSLYVDTITVESIQGDTRYSTAVSVSKKGWSSGANTVILVNGTATVDGITATPLASIKDAPILLVDKNSIPVETKTELLRLNPNNIILIGGNHVIDYPIENQLKSILSNVNISRFGGSTRYETALNIAKEISKTQDIKTIYVTGGTGEADALSIASKAGYDKQPIILSDKDNIDYSSLNWIKNQSVNNAYFIGGPAVISNSVINEINKVTSQDVTLNRISGEDRYETNARVIEKFYTNSVYNSVICTKGDPLVDALTSGPLSVKLNIPIIMLGNNVGSVQNNVLSNKNTNLIYKVGGGININSFNIIKNLLK